MLTAAQVNDYLCESIDDVYSHPLMYGETAATVEAVLNLYHDLWAVIHERQMDFMQVRSDVQSEQLANADLFSNNFARSHPQSNEAERVEYAISQWKRIDERLGLTIAHTRSSP